MRAMSWLLALAAVLACAGGRVHAYHERSGSFLATQDCQAFVSIRRRSNPDAVFTVAGQSYAVRALNREDGAFVHLEIPGAAAPLRWVRRDCGRLLPAPDASAPALAPAPEAAAFAPFFDTADGPADPSPAPPALDPLDRAVLELCGDWGSRPDADAFRRMLDRPALAAEVGAIHAALDGRATAQAGDPARFRDELTRAWFRRDGFRHIFCGEPRGDTVGGLHFAGRYLQMQQESWGGLAPDCDRMEIEPPVYTFGVRYRIPGGGLGTACPKGYAANLDAAELIVEATRAFRRMQPPATGRAACLHRVAEPGERPYLAVFVARDGAILTFYPDASPACDNGGPPQACLCGGARP